MILPIVAYGDPVLRKPCEEIDEGYEGLKNLIANMWDTMYNANGVGLAAPQIGQSIRLFIVDGAGFAEDEPELEHFKKVFINPIIVEEIGDPWIFNEGCLSIPGIREDVSRQPRITVEYFDEAFQLKEESFEGIAARIIQHEYDHIEGVLFIDKIPPITRKMLSSRLERITKGQVDVHYKMKFPFRK